MADREKKKGKMEIRKFEHPKNEKSFLDKIKNIFHSFWKGYSLVKNKNLLQNSGNIFHVWKFHLNSAMYHSHLYSQEDVK